MKRLFLFLVAFLFLLPAIYTQDSSQQSSPQLTAYLMAHFGPEEKLYYAYSRDARNWTSLNNGRPVFAPDARLRDPYVQRVKGRFHMVHTEGWDYPNIFHWESDNLMDWTGGRIQVVPPEKQRCWAPEFFYSPQEDLFYVYWASIHDGHNTLHYLTTRDWKGIRPAQSAIYYNIGIHCIDLTIVEHDGTYYSFHKPGDVQDLMGNRMIVSKTLNPALESFSFGKEGIGREVFPEQNKPIEGPEGIKLISEDRWYIYGDPFHAPMQAWETTDFKTFTPIAVTTPKGSKHCSMLPITEAELNALLERYPANTQ